MREESSDTYRGFRISAEGEEAIRQISKKLFSGSVQQHPFCEECSGIPLEEMGRHISEYPMSVHGAIWDEVKAFGEFLKSSGMPYDTKDMQFDLSPGEGKSRIRVYNGCRYEMDISVGHKMPEHISSVNSVYRVRDEL